MNLIYAECPQCGKTAYGREEIKKYFGFRFGGTVPQSWCRECRKAGSRCGYNLCPFSDEYPRCRKSIKCPLNDD